MPNDSEGAQALGGRPVGRPAPSHLEAAAAQLAYGLAQLGVGIGPHPLPGKLLDAQAERELAVARFFDSLAKLADSGRAALNIVVTAELEEQRQREARAGRR